MTPLAGAFFSYYTDWQRDDPELGRNKWTVFLTQELPPIIDAEFGTSGVNAIAARRCIGVSTSTADVSKRARRRAVLRPDRGRESRRSRLGNMWGPLGGPGWVANDPLVNAEKLVAQPCSSPRRRDFPESTTL
ncbi:hypothetical protein ACFVJ3_09680 [Rhodococcus sp. NPDC127593]|uniref:hypothetical protein n=1 Tax=Rhodococcus sp. NPDC127593 TaxID=3345404 RepID=UPI00363CC9F1